MMHTSVFINHDEFLEHLRVAKEHLEDISFHQTRVDTSLFRTEEGLEEMEEICNRDGHKKFAQKIRMILNRDGVE